MPDVQPLDSHFAQCLEDDGESGENPSAIPSGNKNGAAQHGLSSSPTGCLEHEVLARSFQEAHAEVGRRVQEISDMVLQRGIIVNTAKPTLERRYKYLLKDSKALFSAITQKMSRLRTKMDLSSSVNDSLRKQHAEKVPSVQTPLSSKLSTCTPRSQSRNGETRDPNSSDRSHYYPALSKIFWGEQQA